MKPLPNNRRKIVLSAIVIALIAAALVTGLGLTMISSSKNQAQPNGSGGSQNLSPTSWIKIGAYATYAGNTSVLGFDVGFTAQLEIIDLNATHIEIQTDFNMSTPYGSNNNSTTEWVSRDNMTYQPEGLTLCSNSTSQITLPGIGTRTCTVYQYSNDGISATYYVDNKIQWPIEMVMTSPASVDGQSYSMDITLVNTNIPGL